METLVCYSCESWIISACHLPGRNTMGHLSLHYDNSFGPLFQFPKRNMLLATFYREVITQSSFTELDCWEQVWQSTLPEHSPLNSLLLECWNLSLGSLTQLFNCRDFCLCSHGIWNLNGRSSISSWDCRVVAVLSLKDTHPGLFSFSFWPQLCLSICIFWKHRCLLIHTKKSGDSTILHIQDSNRYGRSSHRTVVPEFFSKGMLECVPGVSLRSSEAVGKHFFEPRAQGLKTKQRFA